jgi:hypothetical protein
VVVERDTDAIAQEQLGPLVLLGIERLDEGRDAPDLRLEVERAVVGSSLEERPRRVAVPPLLGLHGANDTEDAILVERVSSSTPVYAVPGQRVRSEERAPPSSSK